MKGIQVRGQLWACKIDIQRQTRHTHIPQIGFRLAIAQADARPVMPISFR